MFEYAHEQQQQQRQNKNNKIVHKRNKEVSVQSMT